MTTLDIILLALLIPSIVSGIFKGFIKQVLGIAALILGAWLASRFNIPVADWLVGFFQPKEPRVLIILSYVLIFIATVVVLNLLAGLLTKIIKVATLGGLNRLLGAIFGAFKAFIVICLAVWLLDSINDKTEFIDKAILKDSAVYEYCKSFAGRIFPYLRNIPKLL